MTPDMGDAGRTAKFQTQTLTVARYGARKKVGAKDAGEVDCDPASEILDTPDGMPSVALGETPGDARLLLERGGDPFEASTGSPRERLGAQEVPSSPSLPAQEPSCPSLSVHFPPMISSFDKKLHAVAGACGYSAAWDYDHST